MIFNIQLLFFFKFIILYGVYLLLDDGRSVIHLQNLLFSPLSLIRNKIQQTKLNSAHHLLKAKHWNAVLILGQVLYACWWYSVYYRTNGLEKDEKLKKLSCYLCLKRGKWKKKNLVVAFWPSRIRRNSNVQWLFNCFTWEINIFWGIDVPAPVKQINWTLHLALS